MFSFLVTFLIKNNSYVDMVEREREENRKRESEREEKNRKREREKIEE